jgi:selenium metabolism protein YedF
MKVAVIINTDSLGKGDEALGKKLMDSFLSTLMALDTKPNYIIFYNAAVKLLIEGSSCLPAVKELCNNGVTVFACGTCTNFFNITEKIAAGTVSNMFEIATILMEVDKVITM